MLAFFHFRFRVVLIRFIRVRVGALSSDVDLRICHIKVVIYVLKFSSGSRRFVFECDLYDSLEKIRENLNTLWL